MFKLIIITYLGVRHTIRTAFWLGLWLFGLGILLSYPLRWWSGDQIFWVRLISYAMPWLLVGLVPGLVAAWLAHRKWLWLALAAPTLFISLTYAPLFLPRTDQARADGASFKVMSYNVLRDNKNMKAVARVIRQEQPDILLLQELRSEQVQALTDRLASLYPEAKLHIAYEPEILQAVISRYPLTPMGAIPDKGRAQKVLVNTPHGQITVWNVHPRSKAGWLRRYQQLADLVAEDIVPASGPLIMGGDFNTTDQNQAYRLINQYLHNAHWEAGWGFGFTFPSYTIYGDRVSLTPPLVRIDHIFYNDYFFAAKAGTLAQAGGSDHLSVFAELAWVK